MDAARPTPVFFAEEKWVAAGLLMDALSVRVGTAVGMLAIDPSLAQAFAEFTENPHWRNLTPEPTWVSRTGEGSWGVTIGEYTETITSEGILAKLALAFGGTLEQ